MQSCSVKVLFQNKNKKNMMGMKMKTWERDWELR